MEIQNPETSRIEAEIRKQVPDLLDVKFLTLLSGTYQVHIKTKDDIQLKFLMPDSADLSIVSEQINRVITTAREKFT